MATVRPFLLFYGRAEEAMMFYVGLFPGSRVVEVDRYAAGALGVEGSIKRATFSLGGQEILCTDSIVPHAFTFSPAMSLFVTCESESQLRRLVGPLLEGGRELMPIGSYGFSQLFAWVNDRYGVSWQLNVG